MNVINHSQEYKSKFLKFYQENEIRFTIGIFLAGFLFDVLTLSEIDDFLSIGQQVAYLIIIGFFLYYNFLNHFEKATIRPKFQKIWTYRELIIHFIFGSLLSIYSLFYFKSSSLLSSFIFIGVFSVILIANELSRVQSAGMWVKFALWALCLNAFFSMMFPILLGFIGWVPFILSTLTTLLVFYIMFRKFLTYQIDILHLKKVFLYPIIGVQSLFVIFYVLGWIPPVPLSAQHMGIYHNIEKNQQDYMLYHQKPFWRFWHNGDQLFLARPGDKIFFFANIYSPARFSDQVNVRWLYKDKTNGWITWDKIPIRIVGGRQEGFRGYTFKSNYQEGDWRVQIETTDGREIGRIYFTVETDLTTDPRNFEIEVK